MKEKVTYVRQLLVFGGGKIGDYRIVKILIYVSLKIRRNTMSIVYYSDENLLIRSMEIDDAKIIYETYLSYGWNPSMQTYQDYYKEQKENKRKVFIAEYEGEVPGATPRDCGNYLLQDLPMAKWESAKYLHEVLEQMTDANLHYPSQEG